MNTEQNVEIVFTNPEQSIEDSFLPPCDLLDMHTYRYIYKLGTVTLQPDFIMTPFHLQTSLPYIFNLYNDLNKTIHICKDCQSRILKYAFPNITLGRAYNRNIHLYPL